MILFIQKSIRRKKRPPAIHVIPISKTILQQFITMPPIHII